MIFIELTSARSQADVSVSDTAFNAITRVDFYSFMHGLAFFLLIQG